MSSRERWIVYPILFLALGLAMRVNDPNGVEFAKIRCQRLTCDELVARQTSTTALTASTLTTSRVRAGGEPRDDDATDAVQPVYHVPSAVAIEDTLVLIDEHGNPQAALVSTKGGGRIDLYRSDAPRGMDERMMWAIDEAGERVALGKIHHQPKRKLSPEKRSEEARDEKKAAPAEKSDSSTKADAKQQPPPVAPPDPPPTK